jgi:hypothetical protein
MARDRSMMSIFGGQQEVETTMGLGTTPDSNEPEPEGRNEAPVWFVVLMVVVVVGAIWVLSTFFNMSGPL